MTRRFLESKLVFAIVACAFVVALGCNALQSTTPVIPVAWHMLLVPPTSGAMHGPTMPPDPWAGGGGPGGNVRGTLTAHGPTMPPDPWAGGGGPGGNVRGRAPFAA